MGYIYGMTSNPITVVETAHFARRAEKRMSAQERSDMITAIAHNPEIGAYLAGGLRKARFAAGSKGKSGGVRIVYYFHNEGAPIFLLEVFAKNERDNLTKAELADLAKLAKRLPETYGAMK